jgi:hypothetical protein
MIGRNEPETAYQTACRMVKRIEPPALLADGAHTTDDRHVACDDSPERNRSLTSR